MIEIIKLVAKQGLAFRAHDESENSENRGNFAEIANWYASKDESFRNFIK